MKKIAEITIGDITFASNNKQINTNQKDKKYHSRTKMICVYTDEKSYKMHLLKCHCDVCGNTFISEAIDDNYYLGKEHKIITCPCCNRQSIDDYHEIVVTNANVAVPIKTILTIMECKEKITLTAKAICYEMSDKAELLCKTDHYSLIKETYTFNFKTHNCTWKKEINTTPYNIPKMIMSKDSKTIEEKEIGYETDLHEMKNKTLLWNLHIQHKTTGNISKFLKTLRSKINKRMKENHLSEKNIYVKGSNDKHIYLNILNYAHRTRFWDSYNYNILWNNEERIRKEELPPDWEQKVYQKQKEDKNYITSVFETLNIPNIKYTRTHFRRELFYDLHEIFSNIKDVNEATTLAKALENREIREEPSKLTLTYVKLKEKYPTLTIKNLIKNWQKYTLYDILYIYETAENIPQLKKACQNTKIRLRDFHDWLYKKYNQYKQMEHSFIIDKEIIKNLTKRINNFQYITITNTQTLRKVGDILHNCANTYRNRINNTKQLVMIKEKNKIIALLEIDHNKVLQAKLQCNESASTNTEINNNILEYIKIAHLENNSYDLTTQKIA